MKIDTSIIQVLITKAKNLKHPSYLFSFDYNKLHDITKIVTYNLMLNILKCLVGKFEH